MDLSPGDLVALDPPGEDDARHALVAEVGIARILLYPCRAGVPDAIRDDLFPLAPEDLTGGELPGPRVLSLADPITAGRSPGPLRVARLRRPALDRFLRARMARNVRQHHDLLHRDPEPFRPGVTPVKYSGRVYDANDMVSLMESCLDFWLTAGRFAGEFESGLSRYLGSRAAVLTNSGSSANLLAISALTSPSLGDRRLAPGDEVVTVAAGFPTTVAPLLQNRLVPVFVDVELGTYNPAPRMLEEAISPRTRALFLPHTLGNPFDVEAALALARRHDLWLIEDNCDALGSKVRGVPTGSFGSLATLSFYPAHHITTGEGGAVVVKEARLEKLILSFRDWGRDCWCAPGKDNTCGKRFDWQLGGLPHGYDHKYIFSHVGYNLKMTDMQAAIGVSQLERIEEFGRARRANWTRLRESLARFEDRLILPRSLEGSDPSWFGFPITMRRDSPVSRDAMVAHLEGRRIATRQLFAGNLTRQPAFAGAEFRIAGSLENTDTVMASTFWIGVYPGLEPAMLDHVIDSIAQLLDRRTQPGARS